ncbi:uncharacterized protein LOC103935916 isoform X3 [Pyrus x bretschneideri]|uniref:uncharacterized protein LOC103935916 isoform X3 n=1 Tax=Pyrus x bretschneideri TaxID=225117 RepID=UPI00203017FE|nr:uncharacterized protein LOC103935916 isoform X3 [Pyrus x bretschneideri]
MSNLVPYLNQIRTLYLDFQTPSSCHVAALPNSPLLSLSPTPRPHSLTLTFNSLSLCTHSPSLETLTSRSRTISRSAHTHKQPPSQSHHHQHPVVSLSLSLVAARRGEAQKTLRRVSSSSRLEKWLGKEAQFSGEPWVCELKPDHLRPFHGESKR